MLFICIFCPFSHFLYQYFYFHIGFSQVCFTCRFYHFIFKSVISVWFGYFLAWLFLQRLRPPVYGIRNSNKDNNRASWLWMALKWPSSHSWWDFSLLASYCVKISAVFYYLIAAWRKSNRPNEKITPAEWTQNQAACSVCVFFFV